MTLYSLEGGILWLMTENFIYQQGKLFCEGVALAEIAAQVGTPVYVYSQEELVRRAQTFITAVSSSPALVCYATKANGNPHLIRLLGQQGLGADVTSGGELFLAQHAGIPPHKIIFSGVGKTRPEIEMALQAGIRALHVESEMELETIAAVAAELQQVASIAVRVNPNIHVETHPYISTGEYAHKFGVTPERAMHMLSQAAQNPWLKPVGVAAHIGSQITEVTPFVQSAEFLVGMVSELASMGVHLLYVDVGGGLGINYGQQNAPTVQAWATAVHQPVAEAGYEVIMEPGRSIVGPSGALVTQVVYTKWQGNKQFVITDAGMGDLIRPTLYGAYHPIHPVQAPQGEEQQVVDVVGPICETGDFLARERPLPPVQPGELLAVLQAGAYGFAMSSNYNGRRRPAEVLVHGDTFHTIRQRQTFAHLLDGCEAS